MKRTDQIVALLIVILGAIHGAFTPKMYPAFNLAALWFLGAGLLMMLAGAMNLLRIRYAAIAPGLTAVCVATNVILVAYAGAIASRLALKQNPQAVLVTVLLLLELLFSIVDAERGKSQDDKLAATR